jgi:hypothetical protein
MERKREAVAGLTRKGGGGRQQYEDTEAERDGAESNLTLVNKEL